MYSLSCIREVFRTDITLEVNVSCMHLHLFKVCVVSLRLTLLDRLANWAKCYTGLAFDVYDGGKMQVRLRYCSVNS